MLLFATFVTFVDQTEMCQLFATRFWDYTPFENSGTWKITSIIICSREFAREKRCTVVEEILETCWGMSISTMKIEYLEYIFNCIPYWLILHIITANFFHKIGHQFVWKWCLFLLNYSHIRVRYYVKILPYPLWKSFVFRRCIWRK